MPNPFIGRKELNLSQEWQQENDAHETDRETTGFTPYLGETSHGVDVPNDTLEDYDGPEGYDPEQDGYDTSDFEEPPKEPEPVPVRIVHEGPREIRSWRTFRGYATPNGARVAGRDRNQTRVIVKNIAAKPVYVGNDQSNCNSMFGFQLSGGDTVTLCTTDAVWVCSGSAESLAVSIIREYVIEEQ